MMLYNSMDVCTNSFTNSTCFTSVSHSFKKKLFLPAAKFVPFVCCCWPVSVFTKRGKYSPFNNMQVHVVYKSSNFLYDKNINARYTTLF